MASVIHKTDRDSSGALIQLFSVNTPDYSTNDWVINPDLSAVQGVEKKYWKVTGNSVVEMNTGEKSTVDSNELTAAKTARKLALREEGWTYIEGRYDAGTQRVLMSLHADAFERSLTNRRSSLAGWLQWQEGVAAHVRSKVDAVDSESTVAGVNAVALNISALDAADPALTLGGVLDITT
jgi:hypothetical protein